MPSFWPACQFEPASEHRAGSTVIDDSFLRGLWQRPEVAPVAESCANERKLHAMLLDNPRLQPAAAKLSAIADADARENYRILLRFTQRLIAAPDAETAYRAVFNQANVDVAPLFLDLLAQLILRHMLDACDDVYQVRAAELLFRKQKVSLQEGAMLLADADSVARHASGAAFGDLGKLLVEARIKPRNISLDVLNDSNAERFWARSGAHDTVLSFQHGAAGMDGFCRVLEKWIARFLSLQTRITPIAAIEEKNWAWHIGLDAQASAMLNDLYKGQSLSAERHRRLLALFRMEITADARLRPELAGRPVYLACGMDSDDTMRIKPQNLLLNMPLIGK